MVHIFGHYVDAGAFWGIVATIIVGVPSIVLAIYAIKRSLTRRDVREEARAAADPSRAVSEKDEPLVDCGHFYGDEIGERHEFDFVGERAEPKQVGDMVEVKKSKPLEDLLSFITGPKQMLVICGSGGLGKSRLLIEAAKVNRHVRFVQTRLFSRNLSGLAALIRDKAHKNDILVFDDCHEYSSDLESLLNAALRTGAKVVAASRYMSSIEETLKRVHATPEVVELGLMVNADQVVPVPKDVQEDIARVSEYNPALAVMAYMHWLRHKTLVGIRDSFGLMERVFKDLIDKGEKVGCRDRAAFLAELAVRGGLFEDEKPMPEHIGLVTELKPMGHITWFQSGEKRVYRVTPEKLRDYIVREVYGKSGILQPAFDVMLALLPDSDAVNVIDMLGIQFREDDPKTRDVWKQACRKLLDKYAGKVHGAGIGFGATLDRKPLELLIGIGYEAWKSLNDLRLVTGVLGDFCAGAEKLDSVEHLNKAGIFYLSTGEPGKAVFCYEKGAKLAEEAGDKLWQATFLGNIGNIYIYKGEPDKALKYLEEALAIDREIGDQQGVADALGSIGLIYSDKGDLDKALKVYEEALAMTREIGHQQGLANQLGNIGLIYRDKGELDKALKYLEEALAIARQAGLATTQANQLVAIGLIHAARGEHDQALLVYNEGLELHRQTGYRQGEGVALCNIGNICSDKGELDKALKYYEESLAIDREIGYQKGVATDLGNIGNVYSDKGEPDKALKYHEEALAIAREVGYQRGVATHLGNIGNIYGDKGELDKALKYLEDALRIQREIGDRLHEGSHLGNIGLIYSAKGEPDKALKYIEEALAIDREIGYQQGVASDLCNIGLIYSAKGEPDKALKYLEEALAIDREIGYQQGVANNLGNIGNIYSAKGEPDKALKHHEEALAIDREIGYQQGVANNLGNTGSVLLGRGKHEEVVPKLVEALGIFLAIGVADGPGQVLTGLVVCEDKLGRKRMEELLKELGLDTESISNLLEMIDQVRQESGGAKK